MGPHRPMMASDIPWGDNMEEEWTPIEAEYQGNDIDVISRDPLVGRLELMADDEIIEVRLTRASAEDLLSALVQFLGHGEGRDAPQLSTVQ